MSKSVIEQFHDEKKMKISLPDLKFYLPRGKWTSKKIFKEHFNNPEHVKKCF